MKLNQILRSPAVVVLALLVVGSSFAADIPDFTFIHAADVHAPMNTSVEVCAAMAKQGPIEIAPGVMTLDPSFVVVAGDISEFGLDAPGWQAYLDLWKDFTVPVWHTLGNHDGPWLTLRSRLHELYSGTSWSFDMHGCHFIGLDNSSPQDPRASITRDQLTWLKSDLAQVDKDTPIFVIMHHMLDDSYFGSPYAVSQVLDMLRPFNLVMFLGGHGHNAKFRTLYGVDGTDGGAVCGPIPRCKAGYSIVSVNDGVVRIGFREHGKEGFDKVYVEKPLPKKAAYPTIEILNIKEDERLNPTGSFFVKANIHGNESVIRSASLCIDRMSFAEDDKGEDPLVLTAEGVYVGQLHYEGLAPGAHNLRLCFIDESGKRFYKSIRFNLEPLDSRLVWRSFIDGSCRAAPCVTKDSVYVGGTDRKLYALDKANGKLKWIFPTKGDTATTPVVFEDTIYFGCGDGKLYALDLNGKEKWSFQTRDGVFSSPVYAEGMVLFGSNDSDFYAVDAKTGKQKWALTDPTYTIEVRPFVYNGTAYFGAWDTFVYAVDVSSGNLKWKKMGYACTQKTAAHRYYSPADCGPVVTNGKVFIADRNYDLGIMDAETGDMLANLPSCASTGIAEDAGAVYIRRTGELVKLDVDGKEIWKTDAETDVIPASPVEKDGVVYAVSKLGLTQAFDADEGKLLWKYQATPQLYVFDQVTVADGVVYVSGMDGSITALKAK